MKKIFILFAAVMCAVSCFKGTFSEFSGNAGSNFEFQGDADYKKDSVYFKTDFFSGNYLIYRGARTEASGSDPVEFKGGFAVSMKRDSSLNLSASPFSMFVSKETCDRMHSQTCAIFLDSPEKPERQFEFELSSIGTCSPVYCLVNNTQLVASYILSDDSPCKFGEGDYLKLTVTGYLNGKKTGEKEWYLADFRSPADSVTTTWKMMSLSKRGNVDSMDFSLESSREELPRYFCLDNLLTSIYVRQQ